LLQLLTLSEAEEKYLRQLFRTRDETQEGYLKMDQISEAYAEYCGRFVEKEEID
jgi:Ca2+-binding EF-hand superfamily protein